MFLKWSKAIFIWKDLEVNEEKSARNVRKYLEIFLLIFNIILIAALSFVEKLEGERISVCLERALGNLAHLLREKGTNHIIW